MTNHEVEADAVLDERIEEDIARGYPLDPEDDPNSPYWVKVAAEHARRKAASEVRVNKFFADQERSNRARAELGLD